MKYSIGSLVEFVVINGALIFYIWKNRERFNGFAYYLHFGISLSGLILLVGATISEVLGFNNDMFQITGTVLLYWFVFLLIGGGPLILVSSLLCWKDWRIIITTVLLILFVSLWWFAEEKFEIISAAFIVYSIPTLYFSLDWFVRRRKFIEQ